MKVAEALPGIIVAIISWIFNRVKEVVGLGMAKPMGIGRRC